MPFIDQSTLTYPATSSFPIRRWLDPDRSPASTDFKNFNLFDLWINESSGSAWIMVGRTASSGTWLQVAMSGTGILTITGDSGGAVGPDGGSNINLISGDNITVTGDAGANTLTLTLDATVADTYTTDSGNAIPSAGVLKVLGSGGLSTSGAGNTVTVTAGATIPTSFVSDSGTATPAGNLLNVLGGSGIDTSGSGDTLTITADSSVATTYTCDSGSATPAASNLNVVGGGSTSTSGSGSTVTITSTGGGIMWNEVTVVGPTSMSVDSGYIANNGSLVKLTLPLTSVIGSVIEIVGKGAGGFQVNQNAGQTINMVSDSTTPGATGTVQSSEPGASISIVCITADTDWRVVASTGNLILN